MLTKCKQRRPRSKTVRRLAQKQLSSKECVTAHSPRSRALKMDGTKSAADTIILPKGDYVERCLAGTEAIF